MIGKQYVSIHCMDRLAKARIELPTRGFSERQVIKSAFTYQRVTGAPVVFVASLCTTLHS